MPAVAIVLDLPAELVLARNRGRASGIVPDAVVMAQLADLRRSVDSGLLAAEAWQHLVRVTEPRTVEAIRVTRIPGPGREAG